MNKFLIALLGMAAGTLPALAEGYQINTLSAKQLGMGHTGVAMKLGAESMYFNPAGLGFMSSTFDASASAAFIMPDATANMPDGSKYSTDCGVSTPMNFSAAFSIYDNLKAGVAFYTPYGSAIDWGYDWPGAVLSQNVSLKVFTVQPSLAWKITDRLSVGAGAMISWGSVDLNKGLITPGSMDMMIGVLKATGQLPAATSGFGNITPASVNLTGDAGVVCGLNIGAMFDILPNWTVGASWRSQMSMKVKKGDARLSYANELAASLLQNQIGLINEANFKAEMPCPWVFSLGTSWKPVKALTLAFDARLTGWHAYRSLDIEFASLPEQFNQHIDKKYSNAWCFSLGAQYAVTRRFDARLGLMVDTTPVNSDYYNPETPGMTKVEPTIGLSFRPVKGLSIDASFMYIFGMGADNTKCDYSDLIGASLAGMGIPGASPVGTFQADYKLHAITPSIGISYTF